MMHLTGEDTNGQFDCNSNSNAHLEVRMMQGEVTQEDMKRPNSGH